MLYGAMNFPVRPVLHELEAIAELGFDYLELTMDPPQAHFTAIRQIKDELLSRLESLGMGLVCHLPSFLFLADLTESIRKASVDETTRSLEVAAELQPLKVVLHPGYITGLGTFVVDQAKDYSLESLRIIAAKAQELGLCLCIENMFPRARSLAEPAELQEVFDQFPSLRFTLDIGHGNIGSQGASRNLALIKAFADRISHVHASDNFGKEDNHLPLGAGTVDFRRIIKALNDVGYDQTITLEVFSRDKEYLKRSREKFDAVLQGL
ncbi:MAG: sugar phosphate isomerase/epimerase [Deltaproteobacteria bacterium]|nr:sugar phosphate isomerase/epimerase [Deltaproteobacteria bacterium]